MSFFKKLAGAFVELPEAKKPEETNDLASLLASTPTPKAFPSEEEAPPQAPPRTALDWTLSEVYTAGRVQEGRNSAPQILKLLEGLLVLSADQRLIALRAMDQADDGWDEATVVADAQRRIAVLDHYVGMVKKDEASRMEAARALSQEVKAQNEALLGELDQQIAALQNQRQKILQNTAASEAQAQEGAKLVQSNADAVRARTQSEKDKYKALINFFKGSE